MENNDRFRIEILDNKGEGLAHIISDTTIISNAQDALEIIMNCKYQDANCLIIHQDNFVSEFFDLKTGLAGEILQKFSTYRAKLAIIGDFDDLESQSFRAFVIESNRVGRVNFVTDFEAAKKAFSHI